MSLSIPLTNQLQLPVGSQRLPNKVHVKPVLKTNWKELRQDGGVHFAKKLEGGKKKGRQRERERTKGKGGHRGEGERRWREGERNLACIPEKGRQGTDFSRTGWVG